MCSRACACVCVQIVLLRVRKMPHSVLFVSLAMSAAVLELRFFEVSEMPLHTQTRARTHNGACVGTNRQCQETTHTDTDRHTQCLCSQPTHVSSHSKTVAINSLLNKDVEAIKGTTCGSIVHGRVARAAWQAEWRMGVIRCMR